jgi:hypothetical protein
MLLPEPARDVPSRPFFLYQGLRLGVRPEKIRRIHLCPNRNQRLEPFSPPASCAEAAKRPVPSIAMIRCRFYDLARAMATPDFDAG